ncbi:cold shock domain-containing protein [Aromatoleum aromaticum]|uniref:Probable cold shock family protein n=1 Tax=Aromatoleum aromaticum (strain DSM 19018 / LMG 30748 / EbN1) TaxID=76114 RepID=Q5P4M3_AROAE|nr:cold shock domain-containing protein [Aromatoleum aromaticum]NMG53514.1 cold-shock protein [Aromatoleum aromaticum]CAI07739.1 probable cold shock family protein [Aromatoleum aromaticum EbN1]
MRIEGTLGKWNDDRGFGFIVPKDGGPEVFVHVSAFPRDGRRPQIGEPLSFEIELDKDRKKRAVGVSRPGRPKLAPVRRHALDRKRAKRSPIASIAKLLVFGALLAYGYAEIYPRFTKSQAAVDIPQESVQRVVESAESKFRCDGRTHCSQMTSCSEATSFLKNCPGVMMDGNNDGMPCEQQWCTGMFTR